jgi:hypothetical protein
MFEQMSEVMKHHWVTRGQHQLPMEMPVYEIVKTEVIPNHRYIDRDVLASMRCLVKFQDTMNLIEKLTSPL